MKRLLFASVILCASAIATAQQLCPIGQYNFNGQCLNNAAGVASIQGQTGTGAGGKGGGITLLGGAPTAPSTATGDVILFQDPSNSAVTFKCSQPTAGNAATATCTATNITLSAPGGGTFPPTGLTYTGAVAANSNNSFGVTPGIQGGGFAFTSNNNTTTSSTGGGVTFTAGNDTASGGQGGSVTFLSGQGVDLSQAGSVVFDVGPTGTPSAKMVAAHAQLNYVTHDSVTLGSQVLPIAIFQNAIAGANAGGSIAYLNDTGTNNASFQFGSTSSTGTCTATLAYTGVPATACSFIDTGTTAYPMVLATNFTAGGYIDGSNQGMVWGAPTGGDKGHGTINATGLYVNGTAVSTGGSSVAVPGTIPDLVFWYETDNILANTTGIRLPVMQNRTPYLPLNGIASANGDGPLTSATTLNSLPTVSLNNSASGRMFLGAVPGTPTTYTTTVWTVFVVFNATSTSVAQVFIGGTSGALLFRVNNTAHLEFAKANSSVGTVIGASTGTITTSTWFQGNGTFDGTNFAFRIARAASGSGSNATSITSPFDSLFYDRSQPANDLNGSVAAIIVYSRVLTGTEITNVENYLNTKWGV